MEASDTFYAHENNNLLDRFKLVCTWDDLPKLKNFLNKTGVIESRSREKMNTKRRFYNLTNLTVFGALLKDVPMGCKDGVLPEPILKNCSINCLVYEKTTRQPYKDKLCLFRPLTFHLHGNQRLEEEISESFSSFINRLDGLSPDQFKGVHINDLPIVEDLLILNTLLYDIDIVDGNIVGELARRVVQKNETILHLLIYEKKCYVNNTNAVL